MKQKEYPEPNTDSMEPLKVAEAVATYTTSPSTIADDLKFLRRRRNFADYDMTSQEFQNHIVSPINLSLQQSNSPDA